jgi:hypothetical protein
MTDIRHLQSAYALGYDLRDYENPYRYGSASWEAWQDGRDDRLLGRARTPPIDPTDDELANRQLTSQP